jgi:hypothetical protein
MSKKLLPQYRSTFISYLPTIPLDHVPTVCATTAVRFSLACTASSQFELRKQINRNNDHKQEREFVLYEMPTILSTNGRELVYPYTFRVEMLLERGSWHFLFGCYANVNAGTKFFELWHLFHPMEKDQSVPWR